MHLEDLTTLPLSTIPKRLSTMAMTCMSDLGEQFAAQSVGQFVIHKVEDAIWAVEKSIEWSAPSEPKKAVKKPEADEAEMNGSQQNEPVPEGRTSRPLPWIFFIPILIMWRGTRLAYETASSLLGKAPLHPEDVVVFLRNRRRGLRAVRIRGKRTMKSLVGSPTIISKMTSLLHPFIVVLNKMLGLMGLAPRKESKRDLEVITTRPLFTGEKKDEANENVLEKINRLSRDPDNIQDDPDFEPDSSLTSEESSSSGADADASEEEKEDSTPVTITEIENDADDDADALDRPPPRTSSFIGEIIEEEEEDGEPVVTDLDSPSSLERTQDDVNDATAVVSEDAVSEDGEFASISSARSSDVFTDTCDSQNSAMQKLSTVFKKSLISQNSF